MQEVRDFLKDCGAYFLATIDGDQPRVRPFGTAEIINEKLYIETAKSKNVSKQIEKNPKVELCGLKDGKWIRVTGKLVRDDRIEAKEKMFMQDPTLNDIYDVYDDNVEVLYFENATAIISSFTEEDKVINF